MSLRTLSVWRIGQATFNLLLLVLFALCAWASYRHFLTSGSLQSFGFLAVNTLVLGLFLGRRRATQESGSLPVWLLAFAGTALPLLFRPASAAGATEAGTVIQLIGMLMIGIGLLTLRRSFAIVPGHRGIRVSGAYSVVRHPIYIAELVALLGATMVSPTAWNVSIWLCECLLQFYRARAEEDLLSADPVYRAYQARVRYRFVPGVI